MSTRLVRGTSLLVLLLLALALVRCSGPRTQFVASSLSFARGDRVLVLAPHPDDEVLGCGGAIQAALAAGAEVRICFLTYGDGNEWSFAVYRGGPVLLPREVLRMGEVRRAEAEKAAAVLGLASDALTFLGYPDFGTLRILLAHWGDQPSLRADLTRAEAVPYDDALRPGAPYKGEEILADLAALLSGFRPTKVLVSHPADQNPDHEALYLFTRIALWDLDPKPAPEIYPYLVHWARWPHPRGYRPRRHETPPAELLPGIEWSRLALAAQAVHAKRRALEEHRTQVDYAPGLLMSFVRQDELFGDLPALAVSPQTETQTLLSERTSPESRMSDELTELERARFVGIEERRIGVRGSDVVISTTFSHALSEEVAADVHLLGYRHDTEFAHMPKLEIRLGPERHAVFDAGVELPPTSVTVDRAGRTTTVTVPLALLGLPEKIMTSGRTSMAGVPLDRVAWRIAELPPDAPAGGAAGTRR